MIHKLPNAQPRATASHDGFSSWSLQVKGSPTVRHDIRPKGLIMAAVARATCRAIDTVATHSSMSKTTPSRAGIQRTACTTYQEWHSPHLGVKAAGRLDSVCARRAEYERVQRRLSRLAQHAGLRSRCKPGMGNHITSQLLTLCPERTGSTAAEDHKKSTTPSLSPQPTSLLSPRANTT